MADSSPQAQLNNDYVTCYGGSTTRCDVFIRRRTGNVVAFREKATADTGASVVRRSLGNSEMS